MDIRSAQIPLQSIPSANDYSTAAAYKYVYPEILARGGAHICMELIQIEKGCKKHWATALHPAVPYIYVMYFHCKDADSHDTRLTTFQFNCAWYCPCECCVQKALHPWDGQIIWDFDNQYGFFFLKGIGKITRQKKKYGPKSQKIESKGSQG